VTGPGTIAGVTNRRVSFHQLFNFRDLGGYLAADGRQVAWRRLYRADNLGRLSGEDIDRFTALGIRAVVDLRRPTEIAEHGRIPELAGVAYHHLHLVHPAWESSPQDDLPARVAYLLDRYSEMVEAGGDAIGDALRLIAQSSSTPLVFHCMAGKDRTGIVAALTLALLGVDDETIAADYTLSEASDVTYRLRHALTPAPYTVVPAAVMTSWLAWLRDGHGSIEGYVKSLGVTADDVAAMREHLLA
jgi:protein tyrosine/serine phosphatase